MYPGTPSHVLSIKSKGGSSAFFVSDDIRTDILNRNALTLMQPDPEQFSGNYDVLLYFCLIKDVLIRHATRGGQLPRTVST